MLFDRRGTPHIQKLLETAIILYDVNLVMPGCDIYIYVSNDYKQTPPFLFRVVFNSIDETKNSPVTQIGRMLL